MGKLTGHFQRLTDIGQKYSEAVMRSLSDPSEEVKRRWAALIDAGEVMKGSEYEQFERVKAAVSSEFYEVNGDDPQLDTAKLWKECQSMLK